MRGMSLCVHNPEGREVARVREASIAGQIAKVYGDRATVRNTSGAVFWTEGHEPEGLTIEAAVAERRASK